MLGLVDELWIHLAPIVLGAGTRLPTGESRQLVQESVRVSPKATHLIYRLGAES
jgi:riboflavin biosynthesis pyrimidine reductase